MLKTKITVKTILMIPKPKYYMWVFVCLQHLTVKHRNSSHKEAKQKTEPNQFSK